MQRIDDRLVKAVIYTDSKQTHENGKWRFVVQSGKKSYQFEASDVESDTSSHRLALLAVVRALESLPAPSDVTLITTSKYVRNGFRNGISDWKEHNWMWERFGEMVPIKNDDLWRRVHHALKFHRVDCRICRLDQPEKRNNANRMKKPAFLKRRRSSRPAIYAFNN